MTISRHRRALLAVISGCLVLALGVLVALILSPPERRLSVRAVGGPPPAGFVAAVRPERRDRDTTRPPSVPTAGRAATEKGSPPAGREATTGRSAAAPSGSPERPPSPAQKPAAPPPTARQGHGPGKEVVVRIDAKDGNNVKTIASGFVVSPEGFVVTNLGVIDTPGGVQALEVKLASGDVAKVASLAALDQDRDLAVLALDGRKNLSAVTLGNADAVKAGDKVTIVAAAGEVKGVRNLEDGTQLIELKDPISPASAGGPVFNAAGQVVCVVVTKAKSGEGLRFCLPIRDVIPIVDGLPGAQIAAR